MRPRYHLGNLDASLRELEANIRQDLGTMPKPKDTRLHCPFCGIRTWMLDYSAFMQDHDRPDGRRCLKAATTFKFWKEAK